MKQWNHIIANRSIIMVQRSRGLRIELILVVRSHFSQSNWPNRRNWWNDFHHSICTRTGITNILHFQKKIGCNSEKQNSFVLINSVSRTFQFIETSTIDYKPWITCIFFHAAVCGDLKEGQLTHITQKPVHIRWFLQNHNRKFTKY